MTTLDFSLSPRHPAVLNRLQGYLAEFGAQNRVDVNLHFLEWPEMWSGLRSIALQREGPVISEVGSTWMGSFVGMNAVRQFSPTEVAHIVDSSDIIPAAWESTSFRGDNCVWSVPWHVDARVLLYWRDMLDAAGVDETTAFQTPEAMESTLERLTSIGIETPWIEGTYSTGNAVYHAASWVWSRGGDYISDDGSRTLLDTPEVQEGLGDYFNLYRFMPRTDELLQPDEALGLFAERSAAVMMSGSWAVTGILQDRPDLVPMMGAALPPGPPFVGGTNLAIWRHISPRSESSALELLRWLMSYEVQQNLAQLAVGALLPSRRDALDALNEFSYPQYRTFAEAIKVGRSMPAISIWSIVEERLATTLRRIGANILQDPSQPVMDHIAREMEPLARRLDRTLAQVK